MAVSYGDSKSGSNFDLTALHSSNSSSFLSAEILQNNFDFMGSIGQGQYGRVWKCQSQRSGRYYACKQIKKARLTNGRIQAVLQEIATMQRLRGHPNVVDLDSVYEDATSVFLLMELLPSGDLFNQISTRSGLPEPEARDVFRAVAEAVKHCHGNGIVHRDNKPENILLRARSAMIADSNGESDEHCALTGGGESSTAEALDCGCLRGFEWDVKLGDFGLAKRIPDSGTVKGCVGSFPYEAPEVLALQEYDFSADMWSMGVLLYAMLSANWPEFKDNKRMLDESRDWTHPVWGLVSDAPKHLIRRMMSVDPNQRPTINEVLENEWFSQECVDVLCPSTLTDNQQTTESAILPAYTDSTIPLNFAPETSPDPQNAAEITASMPAAQAAATAAAAAVTQPHLLNAMGDFSEACSMPDPPLTPAGLATISSFSSSTSSVSNSNSCCSSDACSLCEQARESENAQGNSAVRRVRTLKQEASDERINGDATCVSGAVARAERPVENDAVGPAQQQEELSASERKRRPSGRFGSLSGWAVSNLWGSPNSVATAAPQEQTERFTECAFSLPLLRLR